MKQTIRIVFHSITLILSFIIRGNSLTVYHKKEKDKTEKIYNKTGGALCAPPVRYKGKFYLMDAI